MNRPLVSIIIRTCQRPDVLKHALDSIRKQTYTNIEVVIVEDGVNCSEKLLNNEYDDLNFIYEATGKKVGRSKAGNRALELANGEYCNFLDDDDGLFPEHVALMVNALENNDTRAVYSVAEEHQITIKSKEPYQVKVNKVKIRYRQKFNRILLYTFNYIPIQSMMFERCLFQELGGLDEELETLEDWDLWVRYSTVTDFLYIDKITSYYHTPYTKRIKQKRAGELKYYLEPLHQKFRNYQVEVSVEDINKEMFYVIREYKDRGFIRYLRIFFRVFFLGEK